MHQDPYGDIKSFITKMQALQEKMENLSEIMLPPPSIRTNGRFNPEEDNKALMEKVRLLEGKINNFSISLPPGNRSNYNDRVQKCSNKFFENLNGKLKNLEEKLGELSKRKILESHGVEGPNTSQIVQKLQAMEDKIELFSKLIPNTDEISAIGKESQLLDVVGQMRELAEKINFFSKFASSSTCNAPLHVKESMYTIYFLVLCNYALSNSRFWRFSYKFWLVFCSLLSKESLHTSRILCVCNTHVGYFCDVTKFNAGY